MANLQVGVAGNGTVTVGSGASVHSPSNNVLTLGSNNSERVRITSDGQLVMGATTSKAKFEIKDNGYTSTSVLQRISADDSSPYALIIANDTCNTTADNGMQFFVNNDGGHYIRCRASGTAGNNDLNILAQNDLKLHSGSSETERVNIKSNGDVGIGTDAPGTLQWRTGNTLDVFAGAGNAAGQLYLGSNRGDGAQSIGSIVFYDNTQTSAHRNVAVIEVDKIGSGTNTRGGDFLFYNKVDNGTSAPVTFKIRSGGNCEIPDGNLTFASGHGIDFSSTSDATGAASELLDDYEEGSWTPVPARYTGGNANLSMSTQIGKYTKIGNLVRIEFYIVISSVTSQGGSLTQLRGLPFLPNASYSNTGVCFYNDGFQHDDDTDYTIITTVHQDNGGVVYFKANGCDAGNGLSTKNFQAGTITGSCTYLTDS